MSKKSLSRAIAQFTAFVHFLMYCLMPPMAYAQSSPDVYVPQGGVSTLVLPDFDAMTSNIPDLSTSQTGVPVINITDPVGSISSNYYDSFTVGQDGLIFNNSLVPGVSFLGGDVGANPNLTTPANIILNQVSSSEASLIAGAVEIFGTRADVIFANPNGIIVNGTQLINTNTATFVTGLVSLGSGGVIFDVTGGALVIGIDGVTGSKGLNLVGRTVSVQGVAQSSDQITISGGAQQFNAATGQATSIAGSGAAPAYAVDGTVYGAAQSGRITVLGNEAGLGVRIPGTLQSTGDLDIMSLGDIDFNALEAQGDMSLKAVGDIIQHNDAAALGELTIDVGGSYQADEGAGLYSGGNIAVDAGVDAGFAGEIQAVGDLRVAAGGDITSATEISVGANVNLNADDDIHVSAGMISAQNIAIDAADEAHVSDTYLLGQQGIVITGTDVIAGENSVYESDGIVIFDASNNFISSTTIIDEDSFDITYGNSFIIGASGAYVYDDIDLDVVGEFVNSGFIYGRNSLNVDADYIVNEGTGVLMGGVVDLTAALYLDNAGLITSDTGLTMTLGTDVFNSGQIQGETISVVAASLANSSDGAILATAGAMNLAITGAIDNAGILQSSADMIINASDVLTNSGFINAGEIDSVTGLPDSHLDIESLDLINTFTGQVYAGSADF
ncbi:MAG: filamentous hemagglutinin N-terminal domain-containing protein, partial [Maricaulaceae bacterium]